MSANAKHTPGPWHVSRYATDTPDEPGTEIHAAVADVFGNTVAGVALRGTSENDNANARLIAAAPELLEAGKELLDLLENWHPMEGWPARTEQAGKLRKAITKATRG